MCCSRAIVSQLGAQHGPTWPQLGPQNHPKMVPRPLPKATLHVKVQTLIFDTPPMVLLDFSSPEVSREAHFRLKIGVLTQHVIQVVLEASCNPLWCQKLRKFGPDLGPTMGPTNDVFWCYVGSWGPSGPRWPQEPPRAQVNPSSRPQWPR